MILVAFAVAALAQGGAAGETAAEQYFREAGEYLDGKSPRVKSPVLRPRKMPEGLPGAAKTSNVPAEFRMEREWQRGEQCGPVALFFLLRAQGIEVGLDDVLKRVPVTDKGTSMAQLQSAAGQFGLATDVIRFVPEEFSRLPPPFIIHWKGPGVESGKEDHFDVIIRQDPGGDGGVMVDTTNCVVTSVGSLRAIATRSSGYALVVRGGMSKGRSGLIWALGATLAVNACLGAYLAARGRVGSAVKGAREEVRSR